MGEIIAYINEYFLLKFKYFYFDFLLLLLCLMVQWWTSGYDHIFIFFFFTFFLCVYKKKLWAELYPDLSISDF